MANRIIVATLYQTIDENNNVYFINIGPDNMSLTTGDNLYMIVEPGNIPFKGHHFTYTINFSGNGPLTDVPGANSQGSFQTPMKLGTVADKPGNSYSYTLTIQYANQTFEEDPKIRINPQG